MSAKPNAEFLDLIANVMAGYGKGLPDAGVLQAWWDCMAPFSASVVRQAFSAYALDRPDFAPAPNGIAARCRLLDGRPGAEEAWAIALTSQNEADTVVWTVECAEAFSACMPILSAGDDVGARMAFKDTYQRLVAQARAAGRACVWSVSIGWDESGRNVALRRAVTAGLLSAPAALALLPAPEGVLPTDDKARAQLAKIKQMLVDCATERERRAEEAHDQRMEVDRAEKAALQQRVDDYVKAAQ